MNIFKRELKAHRKSLIFWCIGIVAMVGSGMGKFATLSASGQSMTDVISQMPESVKAITGIGDLDISTAAGYYGVLFFYLLLMAAIHAAIIGATIISKEERDKTAEFLFARPVSRNRVVGFKLLAAFVNIAIFNLFTLAASLVIVGSFSKGEAIGGDIALMMAGMFILQLLFLTIGTAIAGVCKKPKKAASLSTAILLSAFMLSVAIDLNEKIEFLKFLTPFKYFEAKKVLDGGGLGTGWVLLAATMIAGLLAVTFGSFKKRDLTI